MVLAIAVPLELLKANRRGSYEPPSSGATQNSSSPGVKPNGSASGAYNGQIRQLYSTSGEWDGGTDKDIIAENARPGTPLKVISHWLDESRSGKHYYLVYVNTEHVLSDRVLLETETWVDGTLSQLDIKIPNTPHLALALCFASFWGEGPLGGNILYPGGGMKLYYPGEDGRVHEVVKGYGDTSWNKGMTLPPALNPHGGIGCSYIAGIQHILGLFDGHFGTVDRNYTTFPENRIYPDDTTVWRRSDTINIHPIGNSSLGFSLFSTAYYQDNLGAVRGFTVELDRETPSYTGHDLPFVVESKDEMPTSLMRGAIAGAYVGTRDSDDDPNRVYFQQKGNDLVEFTQAKDGLSYRRVTIASVPQHLFAA